MFGFCLVNYFEAPWYETLVLELDFTPKIGFELENSRIHTVTSLRNVKSLTFAPIVQATSLEVEEEA